MCLPERYRSATPPSALQSNKGIRLKQGDTKTLSLQWLNHSARRNKTPVSVKSSIFFGRYLGHGIFVGEAVVRPVAISDLVSKLAFR